MIDNDYKCNMAITEIFHTRQILTIMKPMTVYINYIMSRLVKLYLSNKEVAYSVVLVCQLGLLAAREKLVVCDVTNLPCMDIN